MPMCLNKCSQHLHDAGSTIPILQMKECASQQGHPPKITHIKELIQDSKLNAKSSVLFSTVCKWVYRGEDISRKYDDRKPGSPFAGSATSPFSVILHFWAPSSPSTEGNLREQNWMAGIL